MNKLAFGLGYMSKRAAGVPAPAAEVPPAVLNAMKVGAFGMGAAALPAIVGGAMPHITAPPSTEADKMQAEHVRDSIVRALDQLEEAKKVQKMKEQFGANSRSIRI